MYSPLEKILYWSFENKVSKHVKEKKAPRTISGLHALNSAGAKKVEELGYTHAKTGNAHLTIVDVALSRVGALLHWPIQVHDALIPFSFAQNYGVLPYSMNGEPLSTFELVHSSKGFSRIPKLPYFANDEIRDELLPIIQNPKFTV